MHSQFSAQLEALAIEFPCEGVRDLPHEKSSTKRTTHAFDFHLAPWQEEVRVERAVEFPFSDYNPGVLFQFRFAAVLQLIARFQPVTIQLSHIGESGRT